VKPSIAQLVIVKNPQAPFLLADGEPPQERYGSVVSLPPYYHQPSCLPNGEACTRPSFLPPLPQSIPPQDRIDCWLDTPFHPCVPCRHLFCSPCLEIMSFCFVVLPLLCTVPPWCIPLPHVETLLGVQTLHGCQGHSVPRHLQRGSSYPRTSISPEWVVLVKLYAMKVLWPCRYECRGEQ
jgi:hypothetical protein